MDSLPVKPGTGPTKPETDSTKSDTVKSLEAIIRGTLGKGCKVEDFPADPETAWKRQHSFLTLWYQCTSIKKPDEKKVFSLACPSLNMLECKQIVNSLHEYKSFLHRKKKNLKTGDKTGAVFKALFRAMSTERSEAQSLKKAGSGSQSPIKLEKRLRVKTSPQCLKKFEKPAEAATSSNADAASSSCIFFGWGNAGNVFQSSQPAEASSNAMDSEQEPAEAESVFSISSEGVIDAADMGTEKQEMPACGKKAC